MELLISRSSLLPPPLQPTQVSAATTTLVPGANKKMVTPADYTALPGDYSLKPEQLFNPHCWRLILNLLHTLMKDYQSYS